MKLCKSCNIEKEECEFAKNKSSKDGLQFCCKICGRIKNKKSYEKNKKQRSKHRIDRYKNNKEKELGKNKEWKVKNLERYKEISRIYYQNNKKEINLKRKIRAQSNSKIRIDSSMRASIRLSLNGRKAGQSWKDLTGYSIDKLLSHLESKFTKGMTWGNYGKDGWEIDHIIPKSYFKYKDQSHPAFMACWAINNLQPLWANKQIAISYGESVDYIGNREKSNVIILTKEIQYLLDSVNI